MTDRNMGQMGDRIGSLILHSQVILPYPFAILYAIYLPCQYQSGQSQLKSTKMKSTLRVAVTRKAQRISYFIIFILIITNKSNKEIFSILYKHCFFSYNYYHQLLNLSLIINNKVENKMGPRKAKRKNDEDDQLDKAQSKSKWASIVAQSNDKNDNEDEQQLYTKPKKQIFNFDFSKQHLLRKQKQPPKKQQKIIILSPQQQQKLNQRLQKQRLQREQKQRIKQQKKQQRKKQLQKQKQQQSLKRQQQKQQTIQLQKQIQQKKGNSDAKKILIYFSILLVLIGALQYQKDIYVRLSKFRLDAQVNYYQVLQTSSGISNAQLKSIYKKLVLKYHPDKNPNCYTCKQKFQLIMQAWQVLGDPQKRQHYDTNSGYINQIPSETVTINAENYQHLLGDSDQIWIIQVYDSTNQYCHYFARFWEEASMSHKKIVRFGRIDVWQQSQMKSYIPYKYQLFPGLYSVHKGSQSLCQVDYDRPIKSIEVCIETRVKETTYPKINDWSQIAPSDKKIVVLGGAVRLGLKMKVIQQKYTRYIDFYQMNDTSTTIQLKDTDHKFTYNVDIGKKLFDNYDSFLQGLIIQQKSICQVHLSCKQTPCLLLLQTPTTTGLTWSYPLIKIKEESYFSSKIEVIKNMTGLFEKFQLGLYQDGKIQLGNFDEIQQLNPENGEVIDFSCIAHTWLRSAWSIVQPYLKQK